MNSRDLIIICLTIILLTAIGIYALSNFNAGETTELSMTSNSILNEGDSLILKLTDQDGSPIPNQKIQLNLTNDKGITENFTFKTNSKGECKLEDIISGNFSFIAKYHGNKKYKESSIRGDLTVNKKPSNKSSDDANKTNTSKTSNISDDNDKYKSDYNVDDVIDGWDPSEHEVSREDLGDGTTRITYDDGYFRIVDKDGNILTYGY